MKKSRKIGYTLFICLFMAFFIFGFSETTVKASGVILPTQYYFTFNGQNKPAGTEYEMTGAEVLVNVTSGTWEPETTVQWVSSEQGVVALETTPHGSNFIKMVRKGPGYSTISAIIKHGTSSYTISCLVKVDLAIDAQKTGLTQATTTKEKILVVNSIGETKQIFLKYANPDTDPVTSVSGSAVTWSSENEGVVTVDETGKVTAVGGGSSVVTITSNTMSSKDKPMSITLKVVVRPEFSLTFSNSSTPSKTYYSQDDKNKPEAVVYGVPSNFVIESNAKLGNNLKWEVYDSSNDKLIPAGKSAKMTYTVSEISGNIDFKNVKAGTYEIYAFADSKFKVDTNAPYAYMKIIVPINIKDVNLVMSVKDTYNLIENSNIIGVGMFNEPMYIVGDQNIAYFDTTNYIIDARRKGTVSIKLTYNPNNNLYDGSINIPDVVLNITVIDGIALSTTNAIIYTKGTLQLNAFATDLTVPIEWSSDNPEFASVSSSGLVTGIKKGEATITAKQTIGGVVKKATCKITVQQSVSDIVIDPNKVTMAIGDYATLHATITPKDLSDVKLKWKSSNEAVVKILESGALTATIQGVAGGNAVISAINQDNVVVGYCHVTVKQPVTSIVLSESSVVVDLSTKKLQLRATVYPENAQNKNIIWTTTDKSKATVDANGMVTFLKPGTVTIIATSEDNPKATAFCNFTIQIPVISVALDETTKTMFVGQSARLSYVMLPVNASNNGVTWTSTNPSVVTVDATGKVQAKSVGTAVIILRTIDGGRAVYCTITVKQVATAIKFDVSELNLKTGETYQIKTTLTPKDSTENDLVWESSDTKVAIVNDEGKITAKGIGTAIILARTDAGAIAYCKVTVRQPVQGLMLNFSEKTIVKGGKFKLKVSITPSSASLRDVTWKSSNEKVATVSEDGEVTGIQGGVAIITCTTVDGGFKETCIITVREAVTTIRLNHENYILGAGKTVTLVATVTTESATNPDVKWTSSNERIATVNQKGKVTAHALGYVTITAMAMDGSEVEASCEIRVVTPVTSLTISKSFMSMLVGETEALKAAIKPSNATFKKAKWTSSDPAVAIVDDDGVVTALKAGNTTITAEAQDNSGKKAICYVVVNERQPATGITLQDKKLTMVPGEEKVVQLVLIPATSTDSYTWSTDNPAVARVDKKTGRITARSTGTAYITVMTDSGKTATVEVNVIGLNMTELTLEQYTTYPYRLEVEGATSAIKWMVDNPQVAIVSNGYVSSRAVGTTNITAVVNGRKLTCKLKVVKIK